MDRLTICIICKNEEKNIKKCLSKLKNAKLEIIVVDTGSTDNTKEIAKQFTEHVYDFAWCNDFAAAKNFAISKALTPYVMIIDSDEFLESIDLKKLQWDIQEHPNQVGRIFRRNVFERNGVRQENTEWINRIFAKDKFCYEGCIHEQVVEKEGGCYETYKAPVTILHTGYDLPEDARRKKAQRNITLLQQELARLTSGSEVNSEENGVDNIGRTEQLPYILYQLGKSYYMAGNYEIACLHFSRALSFDLNPKLEYVIDMVETYGYALLNSGQPGQALFFENIYEEFGNSADFQFLMGLIYMNNERFEDAVAEFKKATKHAECRNIGTNSYLAYYNIGVIYECLGRAKEAKEYYMRCGDYEPAKKRIE